MNLHGIQVLDNSRRERILHHVDYEDILYVMGSGNTLKLGFTMQAPGGKPLPDCKVEFTLAQRAGHKARSLAEDIISYSQLRLLEMTKCNQAEFLTRQHPTALFVGRRLETGDDASQSDNEDQKQVQFLNGESRQAPVKTSEENLFISG